MVMHAVRWNAASTAVARSAPTASRLASSRRAVVRPLRPPPHAASPSCPCCLVCGSRRPRRGRVAPPRSSHAVAPEASRVLAMAKLGQLGWAASAVGHSAAWAGSSP
ncbi:hypothetical protein PR202_ga03667 [Eleusine coracana subsp. coracana]|uniref:Uncharacterized protein n=1 Tax=Eleusine coracana subsp. coracana TaxID=191504 RepID=A0AAV5BMQ0_ELECO|nr:hypothetical protein PR202_ga03667 [Eleusine coracana subsp. coracana]